MFCSDSGPMLCLSWLKGDPSEYVDVSYGYQWHSPNHFKWYFYWLDWKSNPVMLALNGDQSFWKVLKILWPRLYYPFKTKNQSWWFFLGMVMGASFMKVAIRKNLAWPYQPIDWSPFWPCWTEQIRCLTTNITFGSIHLQNFRVPFLSSWQVQKGPK